jgi:hypothetical protein
MSKIKRQVFYSFHYDNDVMRVQLIRNMGALDGNAPVSANEWETIKRNGDKAIQKWIDVNMDYRSCVIVLIGQETANRKWVKSEIQKAWNDRKGLLGIYIHNLRDPRAGTCGQGQNPFTPFTMSDGRQLSDVVKCYNPNSFDTYNDIQNNIGTWIENAIAQRL